MQEHPCSPCTCLSRTELPRKLYTSRAQLSIVSRMLLNMNHQYVAWCRSSFLSILFYRGYEEPSQISQALHYSSNSQQYILPVNETSSSGRTRKHQSRGFPSHKVLLFSPSYVPGFPSRKMWRQRSPHVVSQNQPGFLASSPRQTNLQQLRDPCHISKKPFHVPVISPVCKWIFCFSQEESHTPFSHSNSLVQMGMA